MKTNRRIARKYCRRVRSWLPGGKMRRAIMQQIKETVGEFVAQNPDADYEALQAQFGQPKEIAVSYVDNMSTTEILSGLRIRRRIIAIVLAVAIIILISWGISVAQATIAFKNAFNGSYIEVYIE